MKKKNVLALALAAGLVFSGTAYAAEGDASNEEPIQPLEITEPSVPEPVNAPAPGPESNEEPKEENNENGYHTEEAADAAGQAAAAASKKHYEVYLQYGNYHYRLLDAPSKEQEEHDAIYKQQPKKLAEDKFNPDQGYATFEEAQKAAEAIIAKSEINKGYNITKGKDGKYYIELTVDAKKTKDLDRKEIKPEVKANNNNNVQTGVVGLTGVVATLAAASTALFKSKRK